MKKINIIFIIASLIFSMLLLISGVLLKDITTYKQNLQQSIEASKRQSSRYLLKDVIDRLDIAVKMGYVDPNNSNSIAQWSAINFSGLRNGTDTSNGFVILIEGDTARIIEDSSVDCANNTDGTPIINTEKQQRLIDNEPIKHKDPTLAKYVYSKIKLAQDTTLYDNYTWNFDGSPEWLEWAVFPTNISLGVNNEPRTIAGYANSNYKKYIFVLGTQSDEVFSRFTKAFNQINEMIKLIYAVLFIFLIFIISGLFYLVYLEFKK